jgi:hypothetical protein
MAHNVLSSARTGLPSYNAIDHGTTVRPSSTSLLCIDSEDRYTSYLAQGTSTPYNFTISQPKTIMNGFFTRIGVSEVVFPWILPNINKKTNLITIGTTIAGGPTTTTVVPITYGFYTPSQLATYLTNYIDSILPTLGFQMLYGQAKEPLFEYSVSAGNTIAFLPMGYNTPAYPFPENTKQLFELLGFIDANKVPADAGNGGYTLCQACRYVDIVCPQLTYNQPLKDTMTQVTARDTLCRIYVGGAPGVSSTTDMSGASFCPPGCAPTVIYRDFQNPKHIAWLPNQGIPGYLQFSVFDDTGDNLNNSLPSLSLLASNPVGDWSMTCLVSEC